MNATRETLPIRGAWLIALLTALAALGQFASSVYLPSMPAMEIGLDASRGAVQATMTAYLAAFALLQVVYGPLADRFGLKARSNAIDTIGGLIWHHLGRPPAPGDVVNVPGLPEIRVDAVDRRAVTRASFPAPEGDR